ncbi:MAG: LysE family translocator [Gammaproteobacteria bacterium]|nr:LysE family translocator [Gammaproteobacteria bacterium]
MFEAFAITLVGVVAAQASPGPNLIAVASAALGQGRVSALLVTLGISTGMLFWAVAVSFGLGALFVQYPMSLTLLKLIGGSYLIWLAVRALMSVARGGDVVISANNHPHSRLRSWLHGIAVVLTNPKAALMWSAVATYLFGANLTTAQVALFGPVGAVSGLLIYGSYAFLFSTGSATVLYQRFSQGVETLFAASFGLFGGKLLIDGVRELRS